MEYTHTYIIENNKFDINSQDNKCVKLINDFLDCYKDSGKNTTFLYQKARFDSCFQILEDIKKTCNSYKTE